MTKQNFDPPSSPTSCRFMALPPSHCCTIVESIREGVLTFDLEKTVTYANPPAEAIVGVGADDMIGRKCHEVLQSELCRRRCPVDDLLAGGVSSGERQTRIIGESSTVKTVAINCEMLYDEQGRATGLVETIRDLTDLEKLRKQVTQDYTIEDIIGRAPAMRKILSFLPDIAESDSAVLIEGDTGTGKEMVAKAIHRLSRRKDGPFVAVNCAALPETLLESELFGHRRGAFTGAVKDRQGRFEMADGGTLFLDEICATSMSFQADLLRVLEDGQFTPLGASGPRHSNFRLITAANEDLQELMGQGQFRADLYYRVGVARIQLPPLARRKEDIPLLVNHFLEKFNLIKGRAVQGATAQTLAALFDYPFPGNIRELENIIEFAFIACKNGWIELEHLPEEVRERRNSDSKDWGGELLPHEAEEALKIKSVLENCRGNRTMAARSLGMGRSTLWRKIKKYGL
ncbi:MAG: sigma-54 interaction domain-containing protein [Desulfurivibrionaceae bacterium]